jgi:hypothetical protein
MYPESDTLREQHTPAACGGVVDSYFVLFLFLAGYVFASCATTSTNANEFTQMENVVIETDQWTKLLGEWKDDRGIVITFSNDERGNKNVLVNCMDAPQRPEAPNGLYIGFMRFDNCFLEGNKLNSTDFMTLGYLFFSFSDDYKILRIAEWKKWNAFDKKLEDYSSLSGEYMR